VEVIMTDVSDDYQPEWDYEPDPREDYEPDPTDHPDFWFYEHQRYMRLLSPLGRVRYRISSFVWRYTWRWRIKPNAGEPPF
jgi:hypothetical protein